jgi:hypothetical protein
MFARIRSRLLAGGGGLALTLAMAGVVAAATVVTTLVSTPTDPAAPVADTTATFEDLDGNGVDDDCQAEVVEDPVAAASAQAAVDENGDGTISVTEAAHSDRTGGTNCNHGGYVSSVAQDADTADETTEETTVCETTSETTEAAPVEAVDPADLAANAHGQAVSDVAHSKDVGGKNCNHGGAVSEAAKKDHEAAAAARDAEKAARDAARDARKAELAAARDAKLHGKGHGKPGG